MRAADARGQDTGNGGQVLGELLKSALGILGLSSTFGKLNNHLDVCSEPLLLSVDEAKKA